MSLKNYDFWKISKIDKWWGLEKVSNFATKKKRQFFALQICNF